MSADGAQVGWVIEAPHSVGLLYWGAFYWSTDNQHAIRFAREIDAQRVLDKLMAPDARVAEHMWCPPIVLSNEDFEAFVEDCKQP